MAANMNTYLETYVESTTNLPPELQRLLATIKALDQKSIVLAEEVKEKVQQCIQQPSQSGSGRSAAGDEVARMREDIDQQRTRLIQWAEEKVNLASLAHELVEAYITSLDSCIQQFEADLQVQAPFDWEYGIDMGLQRGRSEAAEFGRMPRGGMRPKQLGKGKRDREHPRQGSILQGAAPLQGDLSLGAPPPPLTFDPPLPNMSDSSEKPQAPGRLLGHDDISPNLIGAKAEMFWPDDDLWYLIQITNVNMDRRTADILYTTGETEVSLSLDEIAKNRHMSLIMMPNT